MLDQIVELLLQVLWLLLNVSCHDPLQSENAVLKEQSKIMNCLFVQKKLNTHLTPIIQNKKKPFKASKIRIGNW